MEILITILYIIACMLLFALAILIHEFGHFIVALKLGLKVEAFSIGFGPAIWKKKVNGVEYRLSWIPLGGYVAIPDVDPEGTSKLEGREGEKDGEEKTAAPRKRIEPWKEILVSVAGPGMNIVLAAVLAVILSLIPNAKFGEIPSVIGEVLKDGAAEKGGMKAGDRVVEVNGHPVASWSEMQTEVQIVGGREGDFVVEREGGRTRLKITPEKNDVTGAWYIMAVSTTNHPGAASWMPNRNPVEQLKWDAGSIFRVLKALTSPNEAKATAGALGGPVMIAEGIYRSLRRDCWDGIGFLRFLNVNLAVLNLLPIPVLDGGLILFAFIALVCRRRLPDWFVRNVTMAFMYLLIAAMGILIVKDSWRSWKIHTYEPETVQTNAVEEVKK